MLLRSSSRTNVRSSRKPVDLQVNEKETQCYYKLELTNIIQLCIKPIILDVRNFDQLVKKVKK